MQTLLTLISIAAIAACSYYLGYRRGQERLSESRETSVATFYQGYRKDALFWRKQADLWCRKYRILYESWRSDGEEWKGRQ